MEHFLAKYSERYSRPAPVLSADTVAALQAWDWPGNVRELENTVNQIVLLGERSFLAPQRPGARTAGAQAVAEVSPMVASPGSAHPVSDQSSPHPPVTLKESVEAVVEEHERAIITRALADNGGNRSRTARQLDVTRKTLALKMAKYGLT